MGLYGLDTSLGHWRLGCHVHKLQQLAPLPFDDGLPRDQCRVERLLQPLRTWGGEHERWETQEATQPPHAPPATHGRPAGLQAPTSPGAPRAQRLHTCRPHACALEGAVTSSARLGAWPRGEVVSHQRARACEVPRPLVRRVEGAARPAERQRQGLAHALVVPLRLLEPLRGVGQLQRLGRVGEQRVPGEAVRVGLDTW